MADNVVIRTGNRLRYQHTGAPQGPLRRNYVGSEKGNTNKNKKKLSYHHFVIFSQFYSTLTKLKIINNAFNKQLLIEDTRGKYRTVMTSMLFFIVVLRLLQSFSFDSSNYLEIRIKVPLNSTWPGLLAETASGQNIQQILAPTACIFTCETVDMRPS